MFSDSVSLVITQTHSWYSFLCRKGRQTTERLGTLVSIWLREFLTTILKSLATSQDENKSVTIISIKKKFQKENEKLRSME